MIPIPKTRAGFLLQYGVQAVAILFLAACSLPGVAVSQSEYRAGDPPYLERPEVIAFIDELAADGLDRAELEALFAEVEPQQRILDLISRPAEARPWKDYRPIFVNSLRIERGQVFMEEQADWLELAEESFGVDPALIAAIIGVETNYGRNLGGFRVIDALVTLGFDYPPRADFFLSELRHYLQLVDEEGLDTRETRGSYAGAMGRGQFISSSYRAYAVDFNGDGRRDLIGSWADAIGSVANYFREHHWETGQPVVARAQVEGNGYEALLGGGYQARFSLDELAEHGVYPAEAVPENGRFSLIRLEGEYGWEYYLGYPNFYVITRYNRSPLYAMAVHQLAEALRQ
ncbi:lytic murein transglycosylase B [Thioalkalivibrio paradoxus]|uniref:Lytic transglycosylase n=1 Tax=Thioalkalivibrio paradoxus ARh 1 TaxID=713585 RepID=W0DLQ8_9GAMM|nr:lytic murein transglycosylase B [Thioalkalivibrio paradoxus]AHE97933.1 lytic transglycosylase [Thioalkalivibrio paradoxus ARh 1]